MSERGVGQFEKIATGVYLEGLAVDRDRNIVWYSDVIGGGVHGLMPDGSITTFNSQRMWTGGVLLNDDGAVLSSGAGGIMWNHPATQKSGWLLEKINGEPINGINEMIPDGTGGIYFGTVDLERIMRGEEPRPSALYRLTVDGNVIKLVDAIGFANGLMLSPDRKRFYCNNTFACTLAFDVRPDLTLANMTTFVTKEDVDGIAADVEGNLWITGFRSGHITRVKSDGELLLPVETPAGAITQIRFGGIDMCDYYINTVPVDGGDKLKEGKAVVERASCMYRGRSTVPGVAIQPTRFKLT